MESASSLKRDDVLSLLSSIPLLRRLQRPTLEKVCDVLQRVRFGPGDSIVRLNDEGAGTYIIWSGEAKVISPPSDAPYGHKESRLAEGDYFGLATTGGPRWKHTVDVVAITEVVCLIFAHEHADLIAGSLMWKRLPVYADGTTKIERILQLEQIDTDTFQTLLPALHRNISGNTYGGQFISQALTVAAKSVNPALMLHSCHSYFLRTGDDNLAIIYKVENTREGQSFATRHVKAFQKGKVVFMLTASFKKEEQGYEHSDEMPNVPHPDQVESLERKAQRFLTDPCLPLDAKKKYAGFKLNMEPIEIRWVQPADRFHPVVLPSKHEVWMRSRAKLPEDQLLHRCVAAFASDMCLLETSLRPHPETVDAKMQVLSLDHSIWFHQNVKADDWLLYACESTICKDGRGFNLGKVFSIDGKLVMTVAQEGLIRKIGESELSKL